MSAKIINIQGIPHIISVTRDISERKKQELEIESKNRELQKMNAENDRFFSILAHDMRSPFNIFLGFTQMMVDQLHSLSPEELRKIALSLSKSATNLYRLLDNLLEWSRMQQNKITFDPELFAVKPKIVELTDLIKDYATNKGIMIRIEVPVDMMVVADIHMFETIIRNLAYNALKFTNEGGIVIISAYTGKGSEAEFSVSDNGIGIPSGMIANLFTLDQKTSRKGTSGEPSTGLGLIICKDFIGKHGGRIWVESEEGKGSTFFFTL